MTGVLDGVEVVLWDFDGALVDSLPGIVHGVGHTIIAMGQPTRSDEEIRGLLGGGARQIFASLFEAEHPDLVELEADPMAAVFIGDMKTDVAAGKAAGVRTIGVAWGYGHRDDLVQAAPDLLVDSAPELVEALRRG